MTDPLRRNSAGRDRGFTLIEMLVTVTILSVVGAIISNITITSMKTARWQEDKTRTLNQAKTAMERVTREIRGANSMTAASPRALTLVTKTGTIRREVNIAVVTTTAGTELRQTVTRSDAATADPATITTSTVLGGLAVGNSEAVFTYADGAGVPLTALPTTPVSYSPENVKTIGVRVLLRRQNGAPPTELYQLVSIRNLEG